MPSTLQASISMSVGGVSISGNYSTTIDGQSGRNPTVVAGSAGSLTTRTGNTDGVITLTTGHGLSSGEYDVYWGDESTGGIQYGVTATIDGNAMTIASGSGDNLPTQDTAVVVSLRVTVDIDFDGDDVTIGGLQSDYRGHVEFFDVDDASLYARQVTSVPFPFLGSCPITGNAVAYAKVSNGDSTYANVIKIAAGFDSTV
jgi:hypothetical protein